MLESTFKRRFKLDIVARFPDVEIFEPNATHKRSSPDMVLLDVMGWAALEFKRSDDASQQPNQERRIKKLKRKGYAAIVSPENAEEVLDELETLFSS